MKNGQTIRTIVAGLAIALLAGASLAQGGAGTNPPLQVGGGVGVIPPWEEGAGDTCEAVQLCVDASIACPGGPNIITIKDCVDDAFPGLHPRVWIEHEYSGGGWTFYEIHVWIPGEGTCEFSYACPPEEDAAPVIVDLDEPLPTQREREYEFYAPGETAWDKGVIYPPSDGGYTQPFSSGDNDDVGVLPGISGAVVDAFVVQWTNGVVGVLYTVDDVAVGAAVRGAWIPVDDIPPIPATAGWPCTVFLVMPPNGMGPPAPQVLPDSFGFDAPSAAAAFKAQVKEVLAAGGSVLDPNNCD